MSNKTETEIKRPIEIKDNSPERVAFDLMELIASKEYGFSMSPNKEASEEQKKRDYWIKLYAQCRKVVNGYSANSSLED